MPLDIQPGRTPVSPIGIGYDRFPDMQPFSSRAGIGYQDLLEDMRRYLVSTLTPYVQGTTTDTGDAVSELTNIVRDAVNDFHQSAPGILTAKLTGVATPEQYISAATKDSNGNVTDWAPAIIAAIADGARHIEFAATYYTIRTPIKIPSNAGVRFIAKGALKAVVLNCYIPAGHEGEAVIDVLGIANGTSYNYAGFSLEGVHIKGNNSVCHGVRMTDLSYPWLENVIIEGFRGAGLYLDLVMDGYLNVTIQDCGRTSGSYESKVDRTTNAKTLYAPLHMTGHGGDHCNMLRITGDVEQNKVSPYVWMHDAGAIGIQFRDIHAEVRHDEDFADGSLPTNTGFDFLVSDGGDIEFHGMNLSGTFREHFILGVFGIYHFSGGRYIGSVRSVGQGDGGLHITDCHSGRITIGSWGGRHTISGSDAQEVKIDYPGNGPFRITDSNIKSLDVTNLGGGDHTVIVSGSTVTNDVNIPVSAQNVYFRNSEVKGALHHHGPNGEVINTRVGGTADIDWAVMTYRPAKHETWINHAPDIGFWNVGDIAWNSAPASGQPIGWVCTAGGSPGTWKAFGIIA